MKVNYKRENTNQIYFDSIQSGEVFKFVSKVYVQSFAIKLEGYNFVFVDDWKIKEHKSNEFCYLYKSELNIDDE
jgi:hypothetical protein